MNGTPTASYTYDAANQVVGWTYDAAGNLTGDGTTTYSYDALNRLTGTTATGQTRAYTYNGDGTLVAATANGAATTYTQDLAGGLSQILARQTGGATTDYLYGQDRLAALAGGVRTWYGADAQGSVRQTLSDAGAVTGTQSYDPWGAPEGGTAPVSFGYAGELQDSVTSQVYLRARWYQPGRGQQLGVDPLLDALALLASSSAQRERCDGVPSCGLPLTGEWLLGLTTLRYNVGTARDVAGELDQPASSTKSIPGCSGAAGSDRHEARKWTVAARIGRSQLSSRYVDCVRRRGATESE